MPPSVDPIPVTSTPDDPPTAEVAESLHDSEGTAIQTRSWYKLVLTDGTELGFTTNSPPNNVNCGPKAPGTGAIFRFVAEGVDETIDAYWKVGTRGYLKAVAVGSSEERLSGFLTASGGAPMTAQFNRFQGWGCTAYPGARSWVLLYILANERGDEMSMRVYPDATDGSRHVIKIARTSSFTIPLDVQFVRFGPVFEDQWRT